jgi:hypothetical protein
MPFISHSDTSINDQFVQAAMKGQRPSDGYFVEFWRLLVEWPEILARDRLFDAAKHKVLAEVP